MPFKIKDDTRPIGQFATALTEALEKKEWSIMDFAKALDMTYEHTRKLVKGMAYPSNNALTRICELLKLSEKEAEKLVVADKIRERYGKIPMELAGADPRYETITRKLAKVDDNTLAIIDSMIDSMIKTQRSQDNRPKKH